MKAVILAGGFGSRLSEETAFRPKPAVEIGGRPILWHIMNIYSAHGVNEFVIAVGYKAEIIKQYFLSFYALNNDISVDLETGNVVVHNGYAQPRWKVHLVDTGLYTQTGGRLKRLRSWLEDGQTFMFTYGDGVADVDIRALLAFHRSHGKLATVTTVRSPERFGRIAFEGDRVVEFSRRAKDEAGMYVEFMGWDTFRIPSLDYIKRFFGEIIERGAIDRITVSDTFGMAHPLAMRFFITTLRQWFPNTPLGLHIHNDYGQATASALMAIASGVDEVHCAVNNLGERAGNVDTEEVTVAC